MSQNPTPTKSSGANQNTTTPVSPTKDSEVDRGEAAAPKSRDSIDHILADLINGVALLKKYSPATNLFEEAKTALLQWANEQIVDELRKVDPIASHRLAATVEDRIAALSSRGQ